MIWYQKHVDRETDSEKLFQFQDSEKITDKLGKTQFLLPCMSALCACMGETHEAITWLLSLNEITIKVHKSTKVWNENWQFLQIWFFLNILSFPSFLCVDKQDDNYKILSLCFI